MPRHSFRTASLLLICLTASGCATISLNPTEWSAPDLFASGSAAPGTPEWWKKHKHRAVFVPREGYQVEGFEGFYDEQGRPINAYVEKVTEHKQDSGLLGDIRVTSSIESIKESAGLGPDEQQAREAYAQAEDHFRKEEYGKATDRFKEAASRGRGSALEQDALFYLAESKFYDKRYDAAVKDYEQLLSDFPNTPHLDKVIRRQFEIARYWEQYHTWEKEHGYRPQSVLVPNNPFNKTLPSFDTLGRALKTYENIRLNDPTGPLADDSIMATANSHFLRGRYSDADYYYQLLRHEYPRSEHQYEAHILGLQCKLRKYQGPDYDATPLEEGKRIVKQLNLQFASKLDDEERKRLDDIRARLNRELALREFQMAKFYDGKKEYGSARYYYARVLKEYPGTELAAQSRDRYLALKDEPDSPEEPLAWVMEKLPESRERRAIASVPLLRENPPAFGEDPQIRTATYPEDVAGEADGGTVVR